MIAIVLAVLVFFKRSWWPHGEVLGQVEGVAGWHSVDAYPDARQLPGIVVFRWEAPLFFANAGAFRQEVRRLVREDEPSWVVVQCEAITDIDVTAGEMLVQLDDELNGKGIHLAFAEMRSRIQDLALRYGLLETLDRDHFYPTLERALERDQARNRRVSGIPGTTGEGIRRAVPVMRARRPVPNRALAYSESGIRPDQSLGGR